MIVCILIATVTLSTFNFSRIIIVDNMGARPFAVWNHPARAKGVGEHPGHARQGLLAGECYNS